MPPPFSDLPELVDTSLLVQLMSKGSHLASPGKAWYVRTLLGKATAFKNDANIYLAIWHSNLAIILCKYLGTRLLQ